VVDPDGKIIVGDSGGNLLVVGPDGVPISNISLEGYRLESPSIGADGTIYIPNHDMLVAVGETTPQRSLEDVPMAIWFALLFGFALFFGLAVMGTRYRRIHVCGDDGDPPAEGVSPSLGPSEEVGPNDGGEHHEPEQDS
jgi:hypothetical protein